MEQRDGSKSNADENGGGGRATDDSRKSEEQREDGEEEDGEEPTSAELFRKRKKKKTMEEERITDMDVKEAVKKLTQAVSEYKKRTSSSIEDRLSHPSLSSSSSVGQRRFYNWNTTHFYPDVHKLDIGILFRHSDKFNELDCYDHKRRNASEGDEHAGYDVSASSSSEQEEEEDRRRAHKQRKDFAQKKKMLLAQPPRSHIENVGATRNGLGVKIDIDLDSCSNSDDDDDDNDKWHHKSPVRLRRIRRQDGRPVSAEINYDAASKKLYIHTLSKRMDTSGGKNNNGGRASEPAGPRAGKISRRLSSPGSGGGGGQPVRRCFDRKMEKGMGGERGMNSLRNGSVKSDAVGMTSHSKTRERRDFIKKLGKLQGLDLYDERPRERRGMERKEEEEQGGGGDGVDDGRSELVSLHSGQLSRSQEDIRYIEPARTQWQVLGELSNNQPKYVCSADRKITRELKSSGNSQSNRNQKAVNHHQPLRERGESSSQAKKNFGDSQLGRSLGWHPRTGSSFENIYDGLGGKDRKTARTQEMEINERKREFKDKQLTVNQTMNIASSKVKSTNIRPDSFHHEPKSNNGQKRKNESKTNPNVDVDHHKAELSSSPMTGLIISQPQSGCHNGATADQPKPRKLRIDARTLMEEEKQKFEDYKMEYRRQSSGREKSGRDAKTDVVVKSHCVEDTTMPPPSIPPDDYVYILRKIHHTRHDATPHPPHVHSSKPQKTTASSGLRVDIDHHQPMMSDDVPLTRSDPELSLCGANNGSQHRPAQSHPAQGHPAQSHPAMAEEVDDWEAKQKAIQLPSEIYLDRYEYNRNMVIAKDGRHTSEEGTDAKMSAFQRIFPAGGFPAGGFPRGFSGSHYTAADPVASFDGNQIHSRRPDVIPSPLAVATPPLPTYHTDTKQSRVREDPPLPPLSLPPLSCRLELLGGQPSSPDRTPRNQAGLLHKPPKPRKEEPSPSGVVGPKQWTYNTTYEPGTPPTTGPDDNHALFAKTSPAGSRDDHFPSAEMIFELQSGSVPRDVCRLPPLPPPPPSPPPPSPPSTSSMNVFRTLPEQYRLSIQEPSSAVTDSLVTKNGILPLYHKESNDAGKVKMPQFPLNPPTRKNQDPTVGQTYPTGHGVLSNANDDGANYKGGRPQRYDKATVFSITGFHKPTNESMAVVREQMSPQSAETKAMLHHHHRRRHHPSELRDFDVNVDDPLLSFNSDSLKQTQWTDAEKRRPFIWNDADKRRPIVDWPDVDSIGPVEPPEVIQSNVGYHWPFEATFDPREQPPYETKNRVDDVAAAQHHHQETHRRHGNSFTDDVDQQLPPHPSPPPPPPSHERPRDYLRPHSDSVLRKASPNQTDFFSSPISCQVRSSEFSHLRGGDHLPDRSGSPHVFYAVQMPASQVDRAADDEGKRPEMEEEEEETLPYPPRPSSRVPLYNRVDPLLQIDGSQPSMDPRNIFGDHHHHHRHLCDVDLGIEADPPRMFALSKPRNEPIGEFGQLSPLMPSLMPHGKEEEEKDRRRVKKSVRSTSQPDVWHPVSGSGNNVQLKSVLEKKLCHQKQLLSDEKTKEKEFKSFENQSKATVEYEKHINRRQESFKAKKMLSIDSELDDLLLTKPLNTTTASSSSHPKKSASTKEEMPSDHVFLPKQKSALELHLSSSFVKQPSASAGTTPSEDLQRSGSCLKREGFNIEVDIQPPRTADSPQIFGMSVRLSASQEQLSTQARPAAGEVAVAAGGGGGGDEMPHISITAIKAKLFGERDEEMAKQQQLMISGRQLPIHVDHQQNKQPALVLKSKNVEITKDEATSNVKSRSEMDDERLYDYVSYKDGLQKKRSKIYDQLTDFERTYEGLNFDDDAEDSSRHLPPHDRRDFHPDPSNVKRLSITNLKLLTESQEKLVPNSSLEYTKEWIRTGKAPEFSSKRMEQRPPTATSVNVDDFRNPSGIPPAENHDSLTSFPRKVIDDMAYRKYGQSLMVSAKSDPDLPFKSVPVTASYPTVEAVRNVSMQMTSSDHFANQLMTTGLDNSMKTMADAEMPKELRKVQIQTQINSFRSPPHFHNDPIDQSEESSKLHFLSGHNNRPANAPAHLPAHPPAPAPGTRVNLRQLNRSSSFESSSYREAKPEVTHPLPPPPPSGVAKLVELFELSQSAPDLTEANLFGESYTETGNPKQKVILLTTTKARRQKTPKDVKMRSEGRSRIRLMNVVNADSGYVESESDSQSSSGPELQPLTSSALRSPEGYHNHQHQHQQQHLSDNDETEEDRKQCPIIQKLNFTGSVQATSSCEDVRKKSETAEERMRRLHKLREEWFQRNGETEGGGGGGGGGSKATFGFDSRLTKLSTADSAQKRNICLMPSAPVATTTSKDQTRSIFEKSGSVLPSSANPPTRSESSKPGKSLDSLDSRVDSHDNLRVLPWESQNLGNYALSSDDANKRTSARTERTIGLDSVRGPEVQKTSINLSLSTPSTAVTKLEHCDSSVLSRVSFPSVQLLNRDNLVSKTMMSLPIHQPSDSLSRSSLNNPTTIIKTPATEYQAEDVKVTEKQSACGFTKEREDETFQLTSDKDRTITELKREKMKMEPWLFEASKRFERTVDEPQKKSFEYSSEEFHHKEQVLTDDVNDVKITKHETQTRAERVFKVEKKHLEEKGRTAAAAAGAAAAGHPLGRRDQQLLLPLSTAFPPTTFRQPSLLDRLDLSDDGEMTDATDVTLDAMVGFNQANNNRPSSPDTLDFSDMEMSASSALPLSKHGVNRVGGFYTRTTEMVQKSSDGSQKLQTMETIRRETGNPGNSSSGFGCSKQDPLPTREELMEKAQSEMKLYRKDRDRKMEGVAAAVEQAEERRRSIKELVDSFEVMTMPFMRQTTTRQRNSEVRPDDVEEGALQGGSTRKD